MGRGSRGGGLGRGGGERANSFTQTLTITSSVITETKRILAFIIHFVPKKWTLKFNIVLTF